MLHRIGSFSPWAAIAFPIPLLAFVALFVRSAHLQAVGQGAPWRGRRVGGADPR